MSAGDASKDAPVDLDDALAVLRYGAEALDEELEVRMAEALHHGDAAALVARLDELRLALQAGDPRRLRRGIGLLGRLAGRDVLAEADAAALRARLGTLVASADRCAAALEARALLQARLQGDVAAAIAGIEAVIARARAWLDAHPDAGLAATAIAPAEAKTFTQTPRERLQRRLDQLTTVQAARDIGLRQLGLLHEQNLELLARYQRIRDVLLPAWRQQALAEAGASGRRHADAAARAYAAIESEVTTMAAKLD